MLAPIEKKMLFLGLGDSIGTPPEGIEAEVVVFHVRFWRITATMSCEDS